MYDNRIISNNITDTRHHPSKTNVHTTLSHSASNRSCNSHSSTARQSSRDNGKMSFHPNQNVALTNHYHPHPEAQHQSTGRDHVQPANNHGVPTMSGGYRSSHSKDSSHNHHHNHQHHHQHQHHRNQQHSPTSFVLHKLSNLSKRKSESDKRKVAERELDSLNSKILGQTRFHLLDRGLSLRSNESSVHLGVLSFISDPVDEWILPWPSRH
ncbi:hypothetical protein PoB_000716400 [Plakobranchus ocellatus]|uniref:Uncharacterized protein n=1 Tax=Plakobranchus ocellatus TaxID=259542 RepID=A0AAV3YEG2_9GAST|nr:hypothetical protein PoB_000716400 [Plakobranchus ocellatus]